MEEERVEGYEEALVDEVADFAGYAEEWRLVCFGGLVAIHCNLLDCPMVLIVKMFKTSSKG